MNCRFNDVDFSLVRCWWILLTCSFSPNSLLLEFQCFLSVSALSRMLCLPRWACLSLVSGLVSHVSLQLFGVYGGVISKSCEVSEYVAYYGVWLGLSPLPVTVTTRIITFLVGDPNLHLPQLLGGGTTQCMTFHQFYIFYPPFSAPLGPFPCASGSVSSLESGNCDISFFFREPFLHKIPPKNAIHVVTIVSLE